MDKVDEDDLIFGYENGNQVYYYNDQLFTGIACEYWPNGQIRSESVYVNGTPKPYSKEWYENGRQSYLLKQSDEGNMLYETEWFEDGALKKEAIYEYGICLSSKEWSEKGELVKEFHLRESNPAFQTLLTAREAFKKGAP